MGICEQTHGFGLTGWIYFSQVSTVNEKKWCTQNQNKFFCVFFLNFPIAIFIVYIQLSLLIFFAFWIASSIVITLSLFLLKVGKINNLNAVAIRRAITINSAINKRMDKTFENNEAKRLRATKIAIAKLEE